ncbi:signal-induced proliferation-associated 1-like protein 2 isoform X2 [Pipistrellus kuhlii]|uniref:signal-induced proliferation-associated 1-like protein 2 isoform X2 n=1 Tax=Pipistrellus kuhlii TaxID=59472 RepID=UPI001E27421C|nr:signal-induced proliferation-associated 1-like protein 2 isoform X2 [Pipistrellus kuhlii]
MSDPRPPPQEEKHKLGRAPSKFKDPPRAMQSDDYFARKFKAINGSMGPAAAPLSVPGASEGGGPANGTPAVPKMGVRARVSEWPPKKDGPKAVWGAVHNGQNGQGDGPPEDPLDLGFAEAKYTAGDTFVHSPQRALHPIRQRSNSDVTISDIDAEDVLDQRAVNPNTGAALHREYGSTSSIDRQGLSGESFFAMLRGYRVESYDPKAAAAPFPGFPDFLPCRPAVSPSLHAAAQISRGELARLSGLDCVDAGAFLRARDRDKPFKRRLKPEAAETSLFRKLRTVRSEHEWFKVTSEPEDGRPERGARPRPCQRCFAHYDVQSILFNINEAVATRANAGKRKNMTTGASAASQTQAPAAPTGTCCESPLGSKEDLNPKENLDADEGDGKSNELVLSCPHFRNETGGEGDRRIALSRASASPLGAGENCSFESSLSSHCTNAGVSVLEVPRENQPIHREKVKRYIIEHIDLGAYYYRKFFYGKEHQNYFGIDEHLGPVAVSIRREKVEDAKEKEGSQFNYRVAFRTSELTTLRGAILEDAVPSTARHGTARGLPLKEVLEYVIPELNIQCLRQAASSPRVPEQLLKLDEQGLSFQHKIGILYCRAGQGTEEEMYNNETAGPAFEEFLDLLGQRVRLKGFSKYRAQLDNKTDSTGTHSLYTTYKDYELMFHVSTMLPHMPKNRQQLLRKRHIGNDIVTIVFQEPGALPFTPKSIRSHFQHVFVIVRVHSPCTESVCYSVGVSRSKDVPPFGPPIPKGVTFPKSAVFRDFLLAKVINAENAAHKSEKFRAMATRTRQEYLKDLAENFVTTATVDTSAKFSFITLGAKKKEKVKPRKDAHLFSVGAIMWHVVARDFGQAADIECLLGISNEFVMLVEKESKNVVFNCSCRDVIGWTSGLMSIKVFYERGECILLSSVDGSPEDIREMVQRLGIVTRGCETVEMTLRRNGLGQLGFHVNFEGIVADVEPFGFAWKAGLRQGSRLVEICKVAVATLTHEQMIDLLRTSVTVKVVIIQPHGDGSPRRGCSELCRVPMVEYKLDSEGTPCEYKTPFRRNTTWHRVPTPALQPLPRASPAPGTPDRLPCPQLLPQAQAAIPRSTSFDRKLPDGTRSSPSNQSSSSDPGPGGSGPWRPQVGYDGCQSPLLLEHQGPGPLECEGARDRDDAMDGGRHPEAKWHGPPSKVLGSYKDRGLQKDGSCKESPNKLSHVSPPLHGGQGLPQPLQQRHAVQQRLQHQRRQALRLRGPGPRAAGPDLPEGGVHRQRHRHGALPAPRGPGPRAPAGQQVHDPQPGGALGGLRGHLGAGGRAGQAVRGPWLRARPHRRRRRRQHGRPQRDLLSLQRLTSLRQPLRALSQKHRVPGHIQSLHRGPQQRPAGARGHVQGLPPPRRREQVRHRLEEVGGQPAPRGARVSGAVRRDGAHVPRRAASDGGRGRRRLGDAARPVEGGLCEAAAPGQPLRGGGEEEVLLLREPVPSPVAVPHPLGRERVRSPQGRLPRQLPQLRPGPRPAQRHPVQQHPAPAQHPAAPHAARARPGQPAQRVLVLRRVPVGQDQVRRPRPDAPPGRGHRPGLVPPRGCRSGVRRPAGGRLLHPDGHAARAGPGGRPGAAPVPGARRPGLPGRHGGAVPGHADRQGEPAGAGPAAAADRPPQGEAGQGGAAGRGATPPPGQPAAAGGVADGRRPAAQVHRVVLQHRRQEVLAGAPRGGAGTRPGALHIVVAGSRAAIPPGVTPAPHPRAPRPLRGRRGRERGREDECTPCGGECSPSVSLDSPVDATRGLCIYNSCVPGARRPARGVSHSRSPSPAGQAGRRR